MTAPKRKYTFSITDFGAVGGNKTVNTQVFADAIAKAQTVAKNGGCYLLIPAGCWVTAPFNLTSHFTLHLSKGATLRAVGEESKDQWPLLPPLPSYGTGRGGIQIPLRYGPFIGGFNVSDVVIEGEGATTSTIDGNGWGWWQAFHEKRQSITRGRLLEFLWSDGLLVQDISLINSPFWTSHFVYSSNVVGRRLVILAPPDAPNTDGFDPDSSENVTLVDSYINTGDDAVAIKSGWDCFGVHYGRATKNVYIRNLTAWAERAGSLSIGSEMSGGVENIVVEDSAFLGGGDGAHIKTSPQRGGYVRDIVFKGIFIDGAAKIALNMGESYGSPNPMCDASWAPQPPVVNNITFENIRIAGHPDVPFKFRGLSEDVMITNISLRNVTTVDGKGEFDCRYISGKSVDVSPTPCSELKSLN